MKDSKSIKKKTCSCQQKSDCPWNQSCPSESLVYDADVNISTTNIYYKTQKKSFKGEI